MKDVKYQCYRRDRLRGASAGALAKVYVNHEALEKRYQAEITDKQAGMLCN